MTREDALEYFINKKVVLTEEEALANTIAIETMRKYQMLQADYEARLKAEMVAMLTEIQLEIEEKNKETTLDDYDCGYNTGIYVSSEIIQQKINSLKEA